MRNYMIFFAILAGISLPSVAGTLVFEAEEEQEIVVKEEPMGVTPSARRTNNETQVAAPPTPKIRCKLPDGSFLLLTAEECKRKQVPATR